MQPQGRVTLSPLRLDAIRCDDSLKQFCGAFAAVAGSVGTGHLFPGASQTWREDKLVHVRLWSGATGWLEIPVPVEDLPVLAPVQIGGRLHSELSLPFVLRAIQQPGRIETDMTSQVSCLRRLTGGIVQHVKLALVTEMAVWHFLSDKFRHTVAVTAECRVARRDKIPERTPMVVLDLVEIFDQSVCHQLVKMQMPFADHPECPWAGSFSPTDPFWTKHPELRDKLHLPGNAWCMPLSEFMRIYTDLYVAQIFPTNFRSAWLEIPVATGTGRQRERETQLPHVPAKAVLSGKEKGGFFAEAEFPTHIQVGLHIRHRQQIHIAVDLLFTNAVEGEFAPVSLTVYKRRGRRVWKHVHTDVIASVSTENRHETNLTLTLTDSMVHADQKLFLVVAQTGLADVASARVLSSARFRVLSEAETSLVAVPTAHTVTIRDIPFPTQFGNSYTNSPLQWSMNPKLLVDYHRDDRTSLMVVLHCEDEAQVAGLTIGRTSCELPQLPKSSLNTHAMTTSAKKRVMERLQKHTHPEFSATCQILPVGNLFVEQNSKCILLENLRKDDFPLVIVPWRADNTEIAKFSISVLADFPLEHCELFDASRSFRSIDAWSSSRRNLGNHSTWSTPGKVQTEGAAAFRVTSKVDLTLRVSLVRDSHAENESAVDSMLSYYVVRDGVVLESANFTPGPVLTGDVKIKAGDTLDILPVTHRPNKRGQFLFQVDALGNHTLGVDWTVQPLP